MPVFVSAGLSKTGTNMLNFLDATAGNAGLNTIDSGETATMNIVGGIINTILGLVGIVFFILMFWSGIQWMTSQGNEEIIKEAKGTIKTATIGIVVVFSSFMITNFILNQLKNVDSSGSRFYCEYTDDSSIKRCIGVDTEVFCQDLLNGTLVTKPACDAI